MRETPEFETFHPVARRKRRYPWLNLLLFLVTFFTTTLAGAFLDGVNPLHEPFALIRGLPFSATLMLILSAHEFGHYVASRRRGVESTLPYFIPAPPAPPMIGTLGAVIRMRSAVPNRQALLSIGAAGPLAGFAVSVPVAIAGLHLSSYGASQGDVGFSLGSSLLFSILTRLVMGVPASDYNIYLHPVAFAGWLGFFITALNLLPIGQTDGGHVLYSVMGGHHRVISRGVFVGLLPMGVFLWQGWLMWAVMMLLLGFRHPPVVDETGELGLRYKMVGVLVLAIFVLTFLPAPILMGF